MKVKFDYSDHEKLLQKMQEFGPRVEEVTNQYLRQEGSKIAMQKLINFTPVSSVNKKHAKNSKPYRKKMQNLGFELLTKGGAANKPGSFGYLIFPDEGRGPRNHVKQDFTGKALHESEEPIMQGLMDRLDELLKED